MDYTLGNASVTTLQTSATIADLQRLPHRIRATDRFVHWEHRLVGGRQTKVPIDASTGTPVDITNPQNWLPFNDAAAALRPGIGLGVALNGDGLIVIDIDTCVNDAGALTPEAQTVIDRAGSYVEFSPSGKGVHVFVSGALPPEGRRRGAYEIYDRARFMTLTGNQVPGTPTTIAENQDFINGFHAEHIARRHTRPPVAQPHVSLIMTDEALMARALRARNGPALERLLGGDLSQHGNDDSAADLAATSILAFWTQDPAQIARIIGASPLGARDKWQARPDYRASTIERALQRGTFYSASAPSAPHADGRHSVPPDDPCTTERDDIAELRAENASLRAERDQARLDLAMVMQTLGNPGLGGDAAGKAHVLNAAYVQSRRHTVPPGGFVQVNAAAIADNVAWVTDATGARVPVSAPARISPRTSTKYVALAAAAGLIDAMKGTIPAPAGKPGLENQGWYWRVAPTLADQLAPLASGSVYTTDNPRPLRGGDPKKRRRIKTLPTCPECGGRHVACAACGIRFDLPAAIDLDSGALLTADDVAQEHPEPRRHTVPTDVDAPLPPAVVTTIVDKFVSETESDRSHTVPPGKKARRDHAAADLAARYVAPPEPPRVDPEPRPHVAPWLPGFDAVPADRYTDIRRGARP